MKHHRMNNLPGLLLALLLMAAGSLPAEATTTKIYCISGNSTGAGWTLGFSLFPTLMPAATEVKGVGGGPVELATQFVNIINTKHAPAVIARLLADGCLKVIASSVCPPKTFHLWVGPAGGTPNCRVTAAGCAFNPVIVEVANPIPVDLGPPQLVFHGFPPLDCVTLNALPAGLPPFTFVWDDGQLTPSITVCPSFTTVYSVLVGDATGGLGSGEVTVEAIDVRCGVNLDQVEVCDRNGDTLCVPRQEAELLLADGATLGVCVTADDEDEDSDSEDSDSDSDSEDSDSGGSDSDSEDSEDSDSRGRRGRRSIS